MKKTIKLLFTATLLVLVGCIIFGGVMTVLKWDFSKLSTGKYETVHHEIPGDFHSISIHTDTADITFAPAEDGKCTVKCHQQENVPLSVAAEDDTLVIQAEDNRKWYERIGVNVETPKLTVFLPKMEYASLQIQSNTGDISIPEGFRFEDADLKLTTGDVGYFASASGRIGIAVTTGDVRMENISAGELDLSTTTGKIDASNVACEGGASFIVTTGKTTLSDMKCAALVSSGSTGSMHLKNVVAEKRFTVLRTTGDVKLEGCDAGEILIETSTGSVTGTLLTEKTFIAETNTGHVHVPQGTTGGKCEIKSNTGNIKLEIQ